MNTRQVTPVRTPTTPTMSFMPVRSGLLQPAALHASSLSADRTAVSPIVHEVRSPGQPQDAATRAFMEPCIGHDFSQVPPHSGAVAEVSARVVNANASAVEESLRVSDFAQCAQFYFARIPVTAPPIQRKPAISSPSDPLEHEADDVADRVVRMLEPMPIASAPALIQRRCAECEEKEEKAGPAQDTPSAAPQSVEGQEEEYPPASQVVIFRKAEFAAPGTTAQSAPMITHRLTRRQPGGESLPAVTRQRMEHAFGRDFSRVRVHRDAEAGEISQRLGALAFTRGGHIYFGHGMYDPSGSSGKRLLAHELTHVVQQGQAARQGSSDAAPRVAAAQAAAPTIQRIATWEARPVHPTINLANSVVNAQPAGVTWPMLNGSTFWSTADARAALKKPTLAFSSAANGGVDARVATVPTNTGSFDETVLAPGPWTITAPMGTIGGMFPNLAMCLASGDTIFQAIGNPSDAAMFAANRHHEDHHAGDHRVAFADSIVPWDTRLTVALGVRTPFNGPTQPDAQAALYTAMGGTPDQVADAFMNACAAAVVAYHGTAAGGPVGAPTAPTANANCSTSSAKYTNPS